MKRPRKLHRPYHVNYLHGFWFQLLGEYYNKVITLGRGLHLKGNLKFNLRWEHVVISLLLGGLQLHHGQGRIVYAQPVSPAPAIISLKPLPKLKDVSYIAQTPLDTVFVSKLRPPGTYGNNFVAGQCTAGVASRLPVTWSGNANQWAYNASAAGYTVSGVPKVESIAQTAGDSYLGHVAIVLATYPDGSFLVWEMNGAGGPFSTDERVTTTAEFPNFIYV